MKNMSRPAAADRRRFVDALRRGAALDAALAESDVEEANTAAGRGIPLDRRLIHNCIYSAARDGGAPHEVVAKAMDALRKRLTFRGSANDAFEESKHPREGGKFISSHGHQVSARKANGVTVFTVTPKHNPDIKHTITQSHKGNTLRHRVSEGSFSANRTPSESVSKYRSIHEAIKEARRNNIHVSSDELFVEQPVGPARRSQGDAHEGFAKLDRSLTHTRGVDHPAALAAWIGRRKLGAKAFNRRAAAGH